MRHSKGPLFRNYISLVSGYTDSAVKTEAFTVGGTLIAAPVMDPAGGTFTGTKDLTISSAEIGNEIYYTRDGATPDKNSEKYVKPIRISSTMTVKAIAISADGKTSSSVTESRFTIK